MQIVKDREQKGGTVLLDHTSFVNCKFINCNLLYTGEDFAWHDTVFVNCTLGLQGHAQRTAAFLQHFGWKAPQQGQPIPQPPGSIN